MVVVGVDKRGFLAHVESIIVEGLWCYGLKSHLHSKEIGGAINEPVLGGLGVEEDIYVTVHFKALIVWVES